MTTQPHPPRLTPDYATPLDEYLDPDERLLWAGRPQQGILFRPSDAAMVPFSLLWAGFAFFWEFMAITGGSRGGRGGGAPFFFVLWGIPFCLAGVYITVGRFFADALVRRRTWYGLTDRRAIIISGLASSGLTSIDLLTIDQVNMVKHVGGVGTIHFGPIAGYGPRGYRSRRSFGFTDPSAFDHIDDVAEVYRLIRQVQHPRSGAAPAIPN